MSDQYIGEVRAVGFNFAPEGWLFCAGQLVSIDENQALYTLLGTAYGGDGATSFALPDLRGRGVLGNGRDGSGNQYILGQIGGTEAVTLATAGIPAHIHPIAAGTALGGAASPDGQTFASGELGQYEAAANTITAPLLSPNPGDQPHENRMPYLAVNYIIATTGIYPSPS